MAFEHVPLTEAQLGPAAWKVVSPDAPAPLQGMVARGLAPLPPRDLAMALYQLWVTNTPDLAELSAKTVQGLPMPILSGALGDATLHPGVLDFVGRKRPHDVTVLEAVVRHRAVHDETLVGLSKTCPEPICDLLAENQDRWLRCPAIVEALYQNPNCRMSVAQRMLELAVRQELELKLPNMDEIKQAIASKAKGDEAEEAAPPEVDEGGDEAFRQLARASIDDQQQVIEQVREAAADDEIDEIEVESEPEESDEDLAGLDEALDRAARTGEEPAEVLAEKEGPTKVKGDRVTQISRLEPMQKIRLALLGSAFERRVLIRDSNKSVCMSAIKSPRIKENEVVTYCANRSLSHDVVRYISTRRDWTKLYAVKLNLVLNPKTPMAAAMTFLGHLHAHDVRKVAHSKNIPSALAQAAKRRMARRR
ncbi:MAG: hypothetical protein AAF799_34805 [Myxococcota bacterium]